MLNRLAFVLCAIPTTVLWVFLMAFLVIASIPVGILKFTLTGSTGLDWWLYAGVYKWSYKYYPISMWFYSLRSQSQRKSAHKANTCKEL